MDRGRWSCTLCSTCAATAKTCTGTSESWRRLLLLHSLPAMVSSGMGHCRHCSLLAQVWHYDTPTHVWRVFVAGGLCRERVPELTGVWVGGMKVAAVGIAVQRWVTMHGLALNVCPNMGHFDHIVPCGIADRPVTCLSTLLRDGLGGGATSPGGQLHELAPRKRMLDAASAMRASLQHVLGIELLPRAATDLPLAAQPAPMKPLLRGKQPPQQHQQQAPDR